MTEFFSLEECFRAMNNASSERHAEARDVDGRGTAESNDAFSAHPHMAMRAISCTATTINTALMKEKGLVVGRDVCQDCASRGSVVACTLEYTRTACICMYSGVEMFPILCGRQDQWTVNDSFNPHPNCRADKDDASMYRHTSIETIVTRKNFKNTLCGYCGRENTCSEHSELVDPGQIARSLVCKEHSVLSQSAAEAWVKKVKRSCADRTRLPLMCCNGCMVSNLHLKSTCFAARATLRKPRERGKATRTGDATSDTKESPYWQSRLNAVAAIERARARSTADQNDSAVPFEETADVWGDGGGEEEHGDDKIKVDPFLRDDFRCFDREFHSSLLNAAIGLRQMVRAKLITGHEADNVIVALFNNSRWRMQREAGIKTQVAGRLFRMVGSPFVSMLNGSSSSRVENEIGVMIESFVEQHLHQILRTITAGTNSERTHLEWNRFLEQSSGFGTGNQSTDALLVAVFYIWHYDGFPVGQYLDSHVPLLSSDDTEEARSFYDFDTWARRLRSTERTKANRFLCEHNIYRRCLSDDQELTTTTHMKDYMYVNGCLNGGPDRKAYSSEPFRVNMPDADKRGNKISRYDRCKMIYEFRGRLLFHAANQIGLFDSMDDSSRRCIKQACSWIVLRPLVPNAPPSLRDIGFYVNVRPNTTPLASSDISLHAKQKRTRNQLYVGKAPPMLPSEAAASEHSAHRRNVRNTIRDDHIMHCMWRRVAFRLGRRERVALKLAVVFPPHGTQLGHVEPHFATHISEPTVDMGEFYVDGRPPHVADSAENDDLAHDEEAAATRHPTKGKRRRGGALRKWEDQEVNAMEKVMAWCGPVESRAGPSKSISTVAVALDVQLPGVPVETEGSDPSQGNHGRARIKRMRDATSLCKTTSRDAMLRTPPF